MILQIKNITKDFSVKGDFLSRGKSTLRAVNNVSLTICEGDHFCLVGESGCGKTTLARMIMRLYDPTEGQIVFDGCDVRVFAKKEYASQVQMVFQDPYSSLDPRFSVRGILKEALLTQKFSKTEQEERMAKMLEQVGLSAAVLERYPHEFSGGERQRIAIARALINHPRVLILDEAVSSLDVLVQKQIMDLLQDLQAEFKLTYVSISHNLRVVRQYGNRVAVMRGGCIEEEGSMQDVFHAPQQLYTRRLIKAALTYALDE